MPFLTWTFRGDNRPLIQAFRGVGQQASAAGKVAGKELGTQFKSAVMAYIGAGAIIGAARKLMGTATKLTADAMTERVDVEVLQELQRAAELTGMTIKDLKEAAPDSIEKFQALMEAIQQSGGMLDKETVEGLQEAADMLQQWSNSFAPALNALVKAFEFVRMGGERGIMTAIGLGTQARGALSGSQEGIDMGREIIQEAQTMQAPSDARSSQRRAAAEFLEARAQAQTERRQVRSFIGGQINSTFGGEGTGELRSMSAPFMMGPMVKELQKANQQLVELNRKVEDKL